MTRFSPIAIVGQGCVLPGALTPSALWENVLAGQDAITPVPEGRWRIDPRLVEGTPEASEDATYSTAGGYVTGFERAFDAGGFALPAPLIEGLDPLFQWVLHAGRAALLDAGFEAPLSGTELRGGVVLGNLSFPSESLAKWGESVFLAEHGRHLFDGRAAELIGLERPDALNRFMSGLPAHLGARALGLSAGGLCLDAACASSLYAMRVAADWLHEGRADVMLAGAVNRADSLFLHVGFCALKAMSPTGRSRPFHREADGLVPAEGAAVVALMRLEDALRQGRRVLGVIRGIGLSNDGRAKNLLAPSSAGQVRAMRMAYEMAGLSPKDVSLVECHATGTPMGDATELASLREVFAEREAPLAIGSLKSNFGHLITAAGAAGLLKVLGALAYERVPPSLHCDEPLADLEGEAAACRVVRAPEDWAHDDARPRVAAVSAFGFGGNNAHLVVEEYREGKTAMPLVSRPTEEDGRLAIVGVGARVNGLEREGLRAALLEGRSIPPADEASFDVAGLRFPPNDLKVALPQQVLSFEAAREAVRDHGRELPGPRTGVLVGMGCDVEITSAGIRWRAREWTRKWSAAKNLSLSDDSADEWARAIGDGATPVISAQHVLGKMPNIPANRLNVQLNLTGLGFTVSAEELSGIAALECARSWLRTGELDAVIVGAVEVSGDVRHQQALEAVSTREREAPLDAAVALVLKRAADAERDGDYIYAYVEASPDGEVDGVLSAPALDDASPAEGLRLGSVLGHAHAAAGLFNLTAGALYLDAGALPPQALPEPDSGQRPSSLRLEAGGLGGARATLRLTSSTRKARRAPELPEPPSKLEIHMPVVRPLSDLPPAPGASLPSSSDVQRMAPAPRLPVVGSKPAPASAATVNPSIPQASMSQATPARSLSAQPSLPPSSSSTVARAAMPQPAVAQPARPQMSTSVWDALSGARADLANAHQAFLEAQGAAHATFLEMRAAQTRQLSALLGSVGEPPIVDVPLETGSVVGVNVPVAPPTRPAPVAPAASPVAVSAPPTPVAPSTSTPVARPSSTPSPTPPSAPERRGGTHRRHGTRERPMFDRYDLERLASGRISEVFGPLFSRQDHFPRQVRMPEPPLLLCDRVLDIDAEPGVLTTGTTIQTETDVRWDSWYLHHGRIPPGVLIESGQADLLLISWMGVDFENQGERVYRLLGCDLTYHRELPPAGSTLHYDIHVDSYATHGDTRLFFFHSDTRLGGPDGELVLSVRNGQAGFFTDEELADSGGVLWTPSEVSPDELAALPLAEPPRPTTKRSFRREELEAFTRGDVVACFGEGFEPALNHVRTPTLPSGDMLLIDRVTELDPRGGPWGRGYLRAELDFTPDSWFFEGHFKDDPCMPGTLMFEGCLETLSFYLASLGYTRDKDGWRFEPVKGQQYQLRCRGQAIPTSKQLVYELFIRSVEGGPRPRVWADILVTIDGLKSLLCANVGLELVPDFPLYGDGVLLGEAPKASGWDAVGGIGRDDEGVVFNQRALLATGIGKPSEAYGDLYADFDPQGANGGRRLARLPNPPYHFMSRVRSIEGLPAGNMQPGNVVTVEYDVPPDAWFYEQNGDATLPFAVLLEIALQPCGWLSSYVGSMRSEKDLYYRNLDGAGRVHRTLGPDVGTLTTTVKMTSMSASGGLIIQQFTFEVRDAHGVVFDGDTTFGFFPPEALARQVGVGSTEAERARLVEPCPALPDGRPLPLELREGARELSESSARLAGPMLLMLDRVTGYWPEGGSQGKGFVRAEKDVNPREWFFKAHFFQDPVQPGSLGVEAMLQAMQWLMLERGLVGGLSGPVFEPIAPGEELVWKYRGQVVPTREKIVVEVDVLDVVEHGGHVDLTAQAWLWCDGLRIYHAPKLTMRARSSR